MTEQDNSHNPDRFAYQRWKDSNLRPLPKPSLSPEEDFLERAMETYPNGNDVSSPAEDSVQSKLREHLESLQ